MHFSYMGILFFWHFLFKQFEISTKISIFSFYNSPGKEICLEFIFIFYPGCRIEISNIIILLFCNSPYKKQKMAISNCNIVKLSCNITKSTIFFCVLNQFKKTIITTIYKKSIYTQNISNLSKHFCPWYFGLHWM